MFGKITPWRCLAAVAIVIAFAIPLGGQVAHAQISPPVSSAGGAGYISQPASTLVNGVLQAFNVLGASHTATFTCTDTLQSSTAAPPGCYAVTGSAINNTVGTGVPIIAATCAGLPAAPTNSTVSCGVLPVGSTASVTINPGSPDTYSIEFTGWVPAQIACPAGGAYSANPSECTVAPSGQNTCPAATPAYTYSNGTCVITAAGLAATSATTCPTGTGANATQTAAGTSAVATLNGVAVPGCAFDAVAQKSYVEISALTNTGVCYLGFYNYTLGAFMGPQCTVTFNATGTIDIQAVSNCASALAALAGTPATTVYGPGTAYVCTGNILGVSGVSIGQYAPGGVPLNLTVTGLGLPTGITLETGGVIYCTGGSAPVTAYTGVPITLCPTSGTFASLTACLNSTTNLQPSLCTEIDPPGASSAPAGAPQKGNGSSSNNPAPAPVTVTASFSSGWQQVGGPAGTSFSTAQSMFSYDPSAGKYVDATKSSGNISSAGPSCSGYWAYFSSPSTATVTVSSHSGDTSACSLAPGWNMVGNPFGSAASLPSGTSGFRWNGSAYEVVSTIPVGGAVWIENQSSSSHAITLTAQ